MYGMLPSTGGSSLIFFIAGIFGTIAGFITRSLKKG